MMNLLFSQTRNVRGCFVNAALDNTEMIFGNNSEESWAWQYRMSKSSSYHVSFQNSETLICSLHYTGSVHLYRYDWMYCELLLLLWVFIVVEYGSFEVYKWELY